ncbi:MAG: FAD-dependent oxidoreductase, partial [Thermoanaerobaculales bacterium]
HPLLADEAGRTEFLLGNEAIARGAIEAGVGFACGYPGTPSTEVTDTFARLAPVLGIPFEYSVNEKVALEMAFAASLAGARSIVAMKHLGLMSAGDPLSTIPYVGTVGGMVIVSAGDPSLHTSPNEQDQRHLAAMLHLPMFDPRTPQEALEVTRAAFDLSERCRLPVVIRPTTRVCHTSAPIRFGPRARPVVPEFHRDPNRFLPLPPNARKMRIEIKQRLETARAFMGKSGFFERRGNGRDAILASGAPAAICTDLLGEGEADAHVTLLMLGIVYPLPEEWLVEMLRELDTVLVVEELSPYLEDRVRALCTLHGLSPKILGKRTGHLPEEYEYTPEIIQSALNDTFGIGSPIQPAGEERPLPNRPPILCAACPHRSAFFAARSVFGDEALYFSDIGCYTLGAAPPLNAGDALLSMGAGFTLAAGVARTTGERTLGFLGDSTFFHSGMPALLNAIKEDVNMVAVIMDNQVTAMTGFQQSPGIEIEGGRLRRSVNIEAVVKALGARHVETIDPNDLASAVAAFERAKQRSELSVVISERACPIFFDREIRHTTGAVLEVGGDTAGSILEVKPDTTGAVLEVGGDTAGAVLEVKPDTTGSVLEIRADTAGAVPGVITTYAIDHDRCQHCGRSSCGQRCDQGVVEGFERAMARARSLEIGKDLARPPVAPCATKCPLFLCIQGYAAHIAAGRYADAVELIMSGLPLPDSVCRVCHRPCEIACVRVDQPVAINDLKRFAMDWAEGQEDFPYQPRGEPKNGMSVAVVGAGPAGLASAHELAMRGYQVRLFDANDEPGGMLVTAIPTYRLPREVLHRDIQRILDLGVVFEGGRRLGADLHLDELLGDHDAIVLALGASIAIELDLG